MSARAITANLRNFCGGFTLVEMAVVLVVIGLLIMTVFPALIALRMGGQRSLTQSNLQALMLATASYVQANGCLPCPTPAATSGGGFGRARGDTVALACNGCPAPEGIPPFASLGVPASVAHDGWGGWITMRVDPALTVSGFGSVTPPTAPCTAADLAAATPTCAQLNASQKGLCQAKLSAAGRVNIQTPGGASQQAAVIFVSHGSKGYGSFQANAMPKLINFQNGSRMSFPAGFACPQNPAVCNADGQNHFVNAMPQDGYDDMLVFADRNALVSMLGNGACQTAW